MKIITLTVLIIFSIRINAQQIDIKTKTEIEEFIKKETKVLKNLNYKKYYKSFSSDFVLMYKSEKINKRRTIENKKKYLKKRKGVTKREDSKLELILNTSFNEFYNDFNLYILTKEDLKIDSKKPPLLVKLLGNDFTKHWNPKINFTNEKYFVCLLPKYDPSSSTVPKYGEFMILQILKKEGRRWKVYSSFQ